MSKALATTQALERGVERAFDLEAEYRLHAKKVGQWALRLGGPSVDVEDVIQEVFFKAQRDLHTFRGEASFSTWLYSITFNEVRHRRRKNWLGRWLSGGSDDVACDLPSEAPSPAEWIERKEQVELLYRVLDLLPEKYRNVIVLFDLEHKTGEEIARLMGAKVDTVWVWLHRARAQFLKRFEELEEENSK